MPSGTVAPLGVLVADDDAPVRDLLKAALAREGMRVWPAADGAEAVALHHANRALIEVALLDVRMPGLTGPEALARMREVAPALACCFMTGHASACGEAGLLGRVLHKPFAPREAAGAVREAAGPGRPVVRDREWLLAEALAARRRWEQEGCLPYGYGPGGQLYYDAEHCGLAPAGGPPGAYRFAIFTPGPGGSGWAHGAFRERDGGGVEVLDWKWEREDGME